MKVGKERLQEQERIATEFTELRITTEWMYLSSTSVVFNKGEFNPQKDTDQAIVFGIEKEPGSELDYGYEVYCHAKGKVLVYGNEVEINTKRSHSERFAVRRTFFDAEVLSVEEALENYPDDKGLKSALSKLKGGDRIALTRPVKAIRDRQVLPTSYWYPFTSNDRVIWTAEFYVQPGDNELFGNNFQPFDKKINNLDKLKEVKTKSGIYAWLIAARLAQVEELKLKVNGLDISQEFAIPYEEVLAAKAFRRQYKHYVGLVRSCYWRNADFVAMSKTQEDAAPSH